MSSYPDPALKAILGSLFAGDSLPEEFVQGVAQEVGACFANGPDDVYSTEVTIWAWICQCLSASKSCVAAVLRVVALRVALGQPPCSAATGAYCKARAKLPEAFIRRLALRVGNDAEDQAPDAWRWKSRRVLLVDGTECSMPDTPANQAEYPQPGSQKPGLWLSPSSAWSS